MADVWKGHVQDSTGQIYAKAFIDSAATPSWTLNGAQSTIDFGATEPNRVYDRYDSGEGDLLRTATLAEQIENILSISPQAAIIFAQFSDPLEPVAFLRDVLLTQMATLHSSSYNDQVAAAAAIAVNLIVARLSLS